MGFWYGVAECFGQFDDGSGARKSVGGNAGEHVEYVYGGQRVDVSAEREQYLVGPAVFGDGDGGMAGGDYVGHA